MNELRQCRICKSLVRTEQINGFCKTCNKNTCVNCKRACDRCQEVCCMFHIESKIIMRQQKPFIHKLCRTCSEVW